MKKFDCIFLDRDGTLNPDPGYINNILDYNFYDFTLPALKMMTKNDRQKDRSAKGGVDWFLSQDYH